MPNPPGKRSAHERTLDENALREVRHWTCRLPWLLNPPEDINHNFIRNQIKDTLKMKIDTDVGVIFVNINHENYRNSDENTKYRMLHETLSPALRRVFEDDVPTNLEELFHICKFHQPSIPGCHVVGMMDDPYKSFENVLARLAEPFNGKAVHIEEDERAKLFWEPSNAQVLVVSGESGSGKTHAALAANPNNPTIFLQFHNDFKLSSSTSCDECDENTIDDTHTSATTHPVIAKEDRARFVKEVVTKVKLCIPSPPQTDFLADTTTIHLVIDELGRKSNYLRLLISESAAIRAEIAKFLLCDQQNIFISCLGTGVNDASTLFRSDPRQYITRHLGRSRHNADTTQPDGNVLVQLFRKMSSFTAPGDVEAVKSFSAHPLIAPLLENYRAAVLVAAHVQQILRSTQKVLRFSLKNTAEQCVYYVSHQFRSLNGLQNLEPTELLECCAHGLRLALCGPTVEMTYQRRLTDEEEILVSTLGIVTERSNEVMAALTSKGTSVSNLPRFKMSRCVALMMLANFGMGNPPISAQSGEGLEFAITQKAVLTFRCCHSVDEWFKVLHCAPPKMSRSDTDTALAAAATNASETTLLHHLSKGESESVHVAPTVNTAVVKLLTPQKRLARRNETKELKTECFPESQAGKSNLELLRQINGFVSDGHRVVVLSGAKAPYADVILISPGFLCLVQCKQAKKVGENEEINKIFDIEDNKDITDCLCHIAGVDRSDITVLFPTTSVGGESLTEKRQEQCNIHIARPAGDDERPDVLFPFTWPATPLQRDEQYSFPLVEKVD